VQIVILSVRDSLELYIETLYGYKECNILRFMVLPLQLRTIM
jgi:hypothetical protein